MSKNFYKILGVENTATKEEIKKAYKKLAKKYHPDINKEEGSDEKFKEVNEAAATLADDEKRNHYDQYGSSEGQSNDSGHQGFDFSDFMNQQGGGGFDFDNIFEGFFGGGSSFGGRGRKGPQRGSDLRYDMQINLEDAATGISKEIIVPRNESCSDCKGSGAHSESDIITCPDCGGQGAVRRTQRTPFGVFATTGTCPKCKGQGKSIKKECKTCDGTGLTHHKRKIKIEIPAGAEEQTNLRVREEGEAGEHGAPPGDLYVVIHIKEHDTFQRDGDDIYVKIGVPFTIAALGGEIDVPTLEGTASLKIPAGTESNTIFRMRGKGIPYLHGHGTGNENVEVVVDVPKKLSKKQKELLNEFQKESKVKKGILGRIFR